MRYRLLLCSYIHHGFLVVSLLAGNSYLSVFCQEQFLFPILIVYEDKIGAGTNDTFQYTPRGRWPLCVSNNFAQDSGTVKT